jgi:hypothetical protein
MTPLEVVIAIAFLALAFLVGIGCLFAVAGRNREDDLERTLIRILQETDHPDIGTCTRVNRLAREVLQ